MTLTQSALLAAIIQEPDCDLHRFVYADLLEEQGEVERAEFIRVQLELAETGLEKCSSPVVAETTKWACGRCTFCRLTRRSEELLHRICPGEIFYPNTCRLVTLVPEDWQSSKGVTPDLYYRRGFVESIVCDWPWWAQHHAEVLACQPVTKVYLTDLPLTATLLLEDGGSLFRWLYRHWLSSSPRLEFVLPGDQ